MTTDVPHVKSKYHRQPPAGRCFVKILPKRGARMASRFIGEIIAKHVGNHIRQALHHKTRFLIGKRPFRSRIASRSF